MNGERTSFRPSPPRIICLIRGKSMLTPVGFADFSMAAGWRSRGTGNNSGVALRGNDGGFTVEPPSTAPHAISFLDQSPVADTQAFPRITTPLTLRSPPPRCRRPARLPSPLHRVERECLVGVARDALLHVVIRLLATGKRLASPPTQAGPSRLPLVRRFCWALSSTVGSQAGTSVLGRVRQICLRLA